MSVCDAFSPVKSLRVCTEKAEWINAEYLELRRQSMRAKYLANKPRVMSIMEQQRFLETD